MGDIIKEKLLTLAADTSQQACSVALCHGKHILAHSSEILGRGHAERLLPMIDEVMHSAGRDYSDLQRLAVVVGPGAYTGVRIGVASVRGLAVALGIDCIGLTSLDLAVYKAAIADGIILSTVSGRGNSLFAQLYEKSASGIKTIKGPCLVSLEDINDLKYDTMLGSGRIQYGLDPEFTIDHVPDCVDLACVAQDLDPKQHPPEPAYFKAADAVKAKAVFKKMD